jgi:RHS repeat-associated protein
VQTIATPATNLNLRFPRQWFQLETGSHYNWHRHYDPTTRRNLRLDPLGFVDDGAASVKGFPTILTEIPSSVGNGALIAGTMGIPRASARALLPDGPSIYGYARQSTIASGQELRENVALAGAYGALGHRGQGNSEN